MIEFCKSREEWLWARYGVGGSDAGAIIGVNKWKSNVDLWAEKTGQREPEDISKKPFVKYGHEAEGYLRGLFALDHPDLVVIYESPYKIIRNAERPWIFCTPDGELIDEQGKPGGLEIKTTEIMNSRQWDEWDDRIPDQYYAQVLHQMLAAGWQYVWLRAQIKYTTTSGDKRSQTRDYYIDREEVEADIKYLLEAEIEFWERVQNGICPPLILPSI